MRDKYAKIDIKLKHNFMNIIAYRAGHNDLMAPPEPAPRAGQWMVVDTALNLMKEFVRLLP
jgi:hypothetical protein